jgi:ketosteroid isomerase-like protein
MREAWDVWSPSVERSEAEGDYVLVIGTSRIRGRGSGLDMDFTWGQVLHLRDGKVLRGKLYSDQEEAETAFPALAKG